MLISLLCDAKDTIGTEFIVSMVTRSKAKGELCEVSSVKGTGIGAYLLYNYLFWLMAFLRKTDPFSCHWPIFSRVILCKC